MKILYLNSFRKGLATNSSSTHSVIYQNRNDVLEDLNAFDSYYKRFDRIIAATKEAKLKYIMANIIYYDDLVKLLEVKYPEIKQYYPLIKEHIENEDYELFYNGDRGLLYKYDNLMFSYDYLCNIIDNDDICIVAGSDETDFFYDTIKDHEKTTFNSYSFFYKTKKENDDYGLIKNGNYYIGYDTWNFGKVRFCVTKDNKPIPKSPELIDLLITKKCAHNCKFCYNDSTSNGREADLNNLKNIINSLNIRTELSIGGGNILTYSKLKRLFKYIKDNGHIINITINADDLDEVIKKKKIIDKYVDGIGISVLNEEKHIDNFIRISKIFRDKFISCHLIPELLGFDKTKNIIGNIKKELAKLSDDNNIFIKHSILFLGFKNSGRAQDIVPYTFSNEELKELFNIGYYYSVDTSFMNKYKSYIDDNYDSITFTGKEGEYSMFIDGVENKAYISSYDLSNPYDIPVLYNYTDNNIEAIFSKIRESINLESFKEKKYYE